MIEYDYLTNLNLIEVNSLGNQGWEVVGVAISPAPPPDYHYYDVFVKRGRQGYEIIEVDSNTSFYIDKSFTLGDSIIIIFLTIGAFLILGKLIYNWIFAND